MWTSAKLLVKGAFSHWLQSVTGVVMALISLAASVWDWKVPPLVWVVLSVTFFLWAIVQAYHDLRLEHEKALEELTDYRDHKKIADTMLDRHQEGNRLLEQVRYITPMKHMAWTIAASKWMSETLEDMDKVGCTGHDKNWVDPTGSFVAWHGNLMDVVQALRDKVARVGQVGAKYQKLVEDAQKKP